MKTLSSAVEDYLKAIYQLQLEEGHEQVGTSALAEKLGVARASVTGMLKKLAAWEPQLVLYERYRGVTLTEAGKKIALEVIRHHRLIECYLIQALGYSWDEVDQEADRLEHVISEDFEARIADRLGHPRIDPHGSPIPDREGKMRPRKEKPLSQLEVSRRAKVSRVSDHDPELLRYLSELGIVLQQEVEVVERAPFEGPIHVRVVGGDDLHALGRRVTDHVFVVEPAEEESQVDG